MSQAQFTIPLITPVPGQLITAQLWINEFLNLQTNLNPSGLGGYSDTDPQMQIQTAPYPGSVTSHASSIAGELERLRYQLAALTGNPYWYQAPAINIATAANVLLPIGGVIDYHSATPPNANFLLANGQAIGRSAYAALNTLYSAASYPFGNGDGSTTFNLPNYNDRLSMQPNSIVASAGAIAGAQTHTLLAAELPASTVAVNITDPGHNHTQNAHNHSATDSGHTHIESYETDSVAGGGVTVISKGVAGHTNGAGSTADGNSTPTQSATANISVSNTTPTNNSNTTGITAATANLGSGTAHSILNPVLGMYKLIRVL
jgi:microcystin-dependent protein